ncbi:hypothetical protein SAURM35S_01455 [Streptomyces aurantiogriseus]|uniref:DUF3558 domain-containing protein n=2 Tax=Streptomyces aurantiogriseus TaxID=66870 RepID=A0A918KX92_9ACTN|nr:hypothetical protein GCM10010251_64740 [Streptomyces aurantiogriseus]
MQRRAQRDDQRDQRTKRAGGLNRLLAAAAALPVMLIAAGCSSDSGSGSGDDSQKAGADTNAGATVSAAPTVQAAAYQSLPEPCAVLSKKTLTELVPKGTKGKEGTSSDTATRASCSWSSLDNNGVKGSQFRWMNVSLLRFESDAASGSGEQQAQEYYTKQIQDAQAVTGATNAKTQALAGTGDEATTVRYDLKKKEGAFKQQTVVTRVENVVVTVDYNGAGLAGEKTPSADTLTKAAEKAAKEAVAAVQSANGEGTNGEAAGGGSTTSPSPGKSSTASPSASSSASPSASPSASASKKS